MIFLGSKTGKRLLKVFTLKGSEKEFRVISYLKNGGETLELRRSLSQQYKVGGGPQAIEGNSANILIKVLSDPKQHEEHNIIAQDKQKRGKEKKGKKRKRRKKKKRKATP